MPTGPLQTTYTELVTLIASVNRAWHEMQRSESLRFVATALRDKKLGLQIELLRSHPDRVRLERDDSDDHELYSLRLLESVRLPGGVVLTDAMHAPVEDIHRFLPNYPPGSDDA